MIALREGRYMFANLAPNRVVPAALGLAALFFGLQSLMTPDQLMVLLNGVFVGSVVAIVVAFHRVIIGALTGKEPYDRALQMTLGLAALWISATLGVVNSIYLRSLGSEIPTTVFTALPRYLAIVAAVLQVTAPDFGLGIFYGRDRRALWLGAGLGAVFAVAVIWFQGGVLYRFFAA